MKKRIKVLAIILLLCALGAALLRDSARNVRLTQYTVASAELPESFAGFKIVQLSDFHGAEFVDDIVTLVKAENPAKLFPSKARRTAVSGHTAATALLAMASASLRRVLFMLHSPCYSHRTSSMPFALKSLSHFASTSISVNILSMVFRSMILCALQRPNLLPSSSR